MTWLSSIFYSLISGLAEVLPVSATAHRIVMQSLLGEGKNHILLQFFLHAGSLSALFYCCNSHILRFSRAKSLARIPKSRRKRPLDTHSLMDLRFLQTALVPILLGFLSYNRVSALESNLVAVSVFLLLNGIVLYIPQFLPGSNKDSRNLSPLDSLLMGLSAALVIFPGFSCVGNAMSVASVRGADKKFALDMSLLISIGILIGFLAMDILAMVAAGITGLTFVRFVQYLFCGVCAYLGTTLGIRILNTLFDEYGISVFAFYCWGLSLFTFIFYLTAA